jgi:hypothetical protein
MGSRPRQRLRNLYEQEIFMETTGQQVGKIEARLRQMGSKLDKIGAKVDEGGPDANQEYRKQIDDVKGKRALVHERLQAFRDARGQKWDNFRGGVEIALRDFWEAFKALKQ